MIDAEATNEVAVTATRNGLTASQRQGLREILFIRTIGTARLQPNINRNRFHHGSCWKGDDQAGWVAHLNGYFIGVHPPEDEKLRAYSYYDRLYPEKPYLVRDRFMVDLADFLVVLPGGPEPKNPRGSGTWYTANYAIGRKCPGMIIWPNGSTIDLQEYANKRTLTAE